MVVEVIYLYICRVNEIRQGWTEYFPVNCVDNNIKKYKGTENESRNCILVLGNVNQSQDETYKFHDGKIDEENKMKTSIWLLFIDLKLEDSNWEEKD